MLTLNVRGPAGPTGLGGPKGPAGTDGATLLSGTGIPAASTATQGAQPGDFYLDTGSGTLYGPLTGAGWPASARP